MTTTEALKAALEHINEWCCYATEEDVTARLMALQQIGQTARSALSLAALAQAEQPKTLTDEQIDRIAENCAKSMDGGIQGFCKTWGWQQFARELLDVCAGYSREQAEPAEQAQPSDLERESAAVDFLLRHVGLDPERCRTEGGAINLGRVRSMLEDCAPKPETWSLYVAGMIGAYLRWPVDDTRIAAIAGIIERRRKFDAAPPAAPQPVEDERKAFEAWADPAGFNLHRDESEKYYDYHRVTTRWAWQAWQARAALAAAPQPQAAPMVPLTDEQIMDLPAGVNNGSQSFLLRFARAIERAHGIGTQDQEGGR